MRQSAGRLTGRPSSVQVSDATLTALAPLPPFAPGCARLTACIRVATTLPTARRKMPYQQAGAAKHEGTIHHAASTKGSLAFTVHACLCFGTTCKSDSMMACIGLRHFATCSLTQC